MKYLHTHIHTHNVHSLHCKNTYSSNFFHTDLDDFGPGLNITLNSTVIDSLCAPIPIRMDTIIERNETFLIRASVIDSPFGPFPLVDFENSGVDIIIIDSTGAASF